LKGFRKFIVLSSPVIFFFSPFNKGITSRQ
jgi:hypothetical protein